MVNQIGKYFIDKDLGRLAVNQIIYNSSEFTSEAGYHHIGGTIMEKNKKIQLWIKILNFMVLKIYMFCGSSVFLLVGMQSYLKHNSTFIKIGHHLIKRIQTI